MPAVRDPVRLAILGSTVGNGHPYSWSAIINGYDREAMTAECPFPGIPAYLNRQPCDRVGLSGASVTHVTRYLAVAWGPDGVRVNAVAPGPSPNPDAGNHTDFVARLADRVPLGRVGVPAEVAGPVLLLASDAGSFITGQTIYVDAGHDPKSASALLATGDPHED